MKGINLSDIKQNIHPLHSCTLRPWVIVGLDGLFINLYKVQCKKCSQTMLVRKYIGNKVALLWELDESEELKNKSREILNLDELDLLPYVKNNQGVIINPCQLSNIQCNMPSFVKDFLRQSEEILNYQIAKHKPKKRPNGSSIISIYCSCSTELVITKNEPFTTLTVLNQSGERTSLPVPLICQIS